MKALGRKTEGPSLLSRVGKLLGYITLFAIGACSSSRPVNELSLADVAIKAAQKAKADSLAPEAFRRAENYFLRAKKDFGDGYYDSAKHFATEARLVAEKAEFQALKKQNRQKGKTQEGADSEAALEGGDGSEGN